jgi:thioredoxin reductase (NADPH)
MAEPTQTIIATRGAQMFPTLTDAEMARLKRFGTPRRFAKGEMLASVGERGHGLMLFLSGEVEIRQRGDHGTSPIVVHEKGSFMGELAQLSGRPSLVEAEALSDVEAIDIPPERLRALLVAEAELGERIMRALILRRVGLLETGAGGPVIVGHAEQGDVLRLANFLRRNGHPFQLLSPDTDSCAQTLIERFEVVPEELPIVLCPGGQLLRNPDEGALARCIGLVGPIDPEKLFDLVVIGAGPSGLATAVYASLGRPFGARARLPLVRRPGGRVFAHRELSRLPDRHLRHGPDGPRLQPGAEVRRRDGDSGRGAEARMRQRSPAPHAGERRARAGASRGDRDRRPLPPARRAGARRL